MKGRGLTNIGIMATVASIATVAALVATPASATGLDVANFSFEDPSIGGGFIDGVPGWTTTGSDPSGILVSTNFGMASDDGVQNAWLNAGSLSQTVAATAQAGVNYTLRVDLGQRPDDVPTVANIFLVVGGHTILGTGQPLVTGDWTTYIASYTALAGDDGAAISIILQQVDHQSEFDNVRLNATPLPAALPLFGTGLGVLGLLGWRRKRKPLAT